jgi:5-methylcytosine-specific restriction endonuclease McrA
MVAGHGVKTGRQPRVPRLPRKMVNRTKYRALAQDYDVYLQTSHWRLVRQLWFKKHPERECAACAAPFSKGFNLHHKHYRDLGTFRLRALVLLCGPCHGELHELYAADKTETLEEVTVRFIAEKREAHRK